MLASSHPHRIFNIEDAINIICSFLHHKSDLARLTTVSWTFHFCATPYLWRDIPGVQVFFGLLDVNFKNITSVIHNRPLLTHDRLSRFKFYTNLVRVLHLPFTTAEEKQMWDLLLATIPLRPLLPKLREFKFSSEDGWRLDQVQAGVWAEALVCPALVDIHLYTKSLGQFSPFFNLRTLVTTVDTLRPTLLGWLATLPRLESIDIRPFARWVPWSSTDDFETIVSQNLPENSFPALRHLALHQVSSQIILELWNTPTLVQHLVSVEIEFKSGDLVSASDAAQVICQNSPRIVELNLNLPENGDCMLSSAMPGCLKELPLRRLKMPRATLNVTSYESLILSLPDIEYLDISSLQFGHEHLMLVSRSMPKLRYLEVNLVVIHWPLNPCIPLVSPSPSALCLAGSFEFHEYFYKHRKIGSYLDSMACLLHSLWPNGVQCVVSDRYAELERATKSDENRLRYLNNKLKALYPQHTPIFISDKDGMDHWTYELYERKHLSPLDLHHRTI